MRIHRRHLFVPGVIALSLACQASFAAKLTRYDVVKLATAKANRITEGEATVSAIADDRACKNMSTKLQRLGGRIVFSDREQRYFSVAIRVGAIKRLVLEPCLTAITIDHIGNDISPATTLLNQENRTPAAAGLMDGLSRPVSPVASLQNSKTFAQLMSEDHRTLLMEIGAERFLRDHPTFDGRGTRVAIVAESAPDFLHEGLRRALSIDGAPIPKFATVSDFADIDVALDGVPAVVGPDAWHWVELSAPRFAQNGFLTIGGRRYRVPDRSRFYRTALANLPVDVFSKIGFTGASGTSLQRAVIWSDETQETWIDFDDDKDFTDDVSVQEYSRNKEFGVVKGPGDETGARSTIGYTTHRYDRWLDLQFGIGDHTTMVAGLLAGDAGREAAFRGVAPGAQIDWFSHGNTNSTFAQALLAAFRGPSDIVLVEDQFPVVGTHDARDQRSVLEVLIRRLIARYGKPCFITAGNQPGLATSWDPMPSTAFVVGAFQGEAETRNFYGITIDRDRALHWKSAEGPSARGALAPNLIAPPVHLTTSLGFLPGGEFYPLYQLPPGYGVFGGSSGATPVAAGAAAILLSGARQTRLRPKLEQLRDSIFDGASFDPNILATQQGYGSINIEDTWTRLNTEYDRVLPRINVSIATAAINLPSATKLDFGEGLFEREGWSAGGQGTRIMSFVRTNGSSGLVPFKLKWVGNDGTFISTDLVKMPLNRATATSIKIKPTGVGVHTAILEVRTVDERVVVRIPFTIIVPYDIGATANFSVEGERGFGRPGRGDLFFRAEPSSGAITIDLAPANEMRSPDDYSLASVPEIQAFIRSPSGDEVSEVSVNRAGGKQTLTIPQPEIGVWQISLQNYTGISSVDPGVPQQDKVTFRISTSNVSLNLNEDGLTARNTGSELLGGVISQPLGVMASYRGEVSRNSDTEVQIEVPDRIDRLIIRSADLPPGASLLLFRKVNGIYSIYRASGHDSSLAPIIVDRPDPGSWKVIVDTNRLDQEKLNYQFDVVLTSPAFGTLVTSDCICSRGIGAEWPVKTDNRAAENVPSGLMSVAPVFFYSPRLRSLHEFGALTNTLVWPRTTETVLLGLILSPTRGTRAPDTSSAVSKELQPHQN